MPTIQTTKIFQKIQEALANGYTTISEQGSSRSSKTYNTLIFLIAYCKDHSNIRLSIVRATLPALKGSVLVDFKEILFKMGCYDENAFNKSELVYRFPNGSWVEFFSCDNEQKLRGRKRDVLFCNEANELSYLAWQQLKLRTTMFTILDYNPSFSDDHWIAQLNQDKSVYHFITTYRDNPFLEQTVIDEIESLKWKNPALWQIYGEGKQAIVEGLVFRNVDYTCEKIPDFVEKRWIGTDYGFSNDPTAIVEVGLCGNDLYVNEICYQTEMLTTDIIRVLKNYPNYEVISESADPRMVEEIYRAGVKIKPVHKFAGSIEAGILKMQEYKIHITKNSSNVIKEFKNYVYEKEKSGKFLNKPVGFLDHSIDAFRYVVMEKIMGGQRKPLDAKKIGQMFF